MKINENNQAIINYYKEKTERFLILIKGKSKDERQWSIIRQLKQNILKSKLNKGLILLKNTQIIKSLENSQIV